MIVWFFLYIGVTKGPLTIRLKEDKKHTQRGETTKFDIAECLLEPMSCAMAILHMEPHWRKQKLIESA